MAMRAPSNPASQDYDYTSSGIDNFLGRAIDSVSWQTSLEAVLNMPGTETLSTMPSSAQANNSTTQMNYNNSQVTGQLGNTLSVGSGIQMNSNGTIVLNDGTNDFLLMGSDGSSSGTSG